MSFLRTWEGVDRPPTPRDADVFVAVYSASERWIFLRQEDMSILAGETRYRPRFVDRDRDIKVREGSVAETLAYRISFADLVNISEADRIDVAVGPKRWSLEANQVDVIREMVAHLKMSSKDSRTAMAKKQQRELEAAQAEAKSKTDAVAARYKRIVAAQDATDAAVEKARKEFKKFPKRVSNAVREKAKWRVFDREMKPVIEKNHLTAEDIKELLKSYPDF
jgi:hypothetical protein